MRADLKVGPSIPDLKVGPSIYGAKSRARMPRCFILTCSVL